MITRDVGIKTLHNLASRCLRILREAEQLYLRGGSAVNQGLRHFDEHWANISNAQKWMEWHAKEDKVAATLCSMFPLEGPLCLSRRLTPQELLRWAEAAISAARSVKDRCAEATNLGNLGSIYLVIGKARHALTLFEQALAIARTLDTPGCHAEANTLCYLGNWYLALGQPLQARGYYRQWITVAQRDGDRRDESIAVGNLGSVCLALGDDEGANAFFRRRLDIAKEIGDRKGESDMLVNLGVIQGKSDNHESALAFFKQALSVARELHDHADECDALTNIGKVYMSLGDIQSAQDTFQQCIDEGRKSGDPRRESMALFSMNQLLDRKGNRSQAIANAKRALAILEPLEDPTSDYIRTQLKRWLEA